MKNLLNKLRDSLGVSDVYAEEPRTIRKTKLPYTRTHFRPSYKMEGKRVIPTKKREFVDDKNLVQEDERPFFDGLGNPKQDGRKRIKVK